MLNQKLQIRLIIWQYYAKVAKVLQCYYNKRKKNTFSLHWASFVHKRKETKSIPKTTIEQGEKKQGNEKIKDNKIKDNKIKGK